MQLATFLEAFHSFIQSVNAFFYGAEEQVALVPHPYSLGIQLLNAAYWEYLSFLPKSFICCCWIFVCFNSVFVLPEEYIQPAHRAN